ncbi:MAG TPA: hypothetical protein EYQ84_10645 [Nitrospinaceae bacterium]|jgi:uncharacterized repeat protein (TIGR04076 family)|nr:hypothetical protein [Nitrospinaceae bacterium]
MVEEKDHQLKLVYDANDNRCRYHEKSSGDKSINIFSQGMCPIAYMNLYPTLFALHLNQEPNQLKIDPQNHVIYCPVGSDGVQFKVYTKRLKFNLRAYLKVAIYWLANKIMPVEVFNKTTHIEVLSEGGGCPLNIKKGDNFYFNLDHTDELCPAAFNSVYPFLDVINNNFTAGCPDYRTHVSFNAPSKEVTEKKENPLVSDLVCDSYVSKVKMTFFKGEFDNPIELEKDYLIDDLIKIAGIRCFTSFHVAFPYLDTLYNGGQLGFLTGKRNSAGICCPNTSLMVKYEVAKEEEEFKYRCIKTSPDCPRKIESGEEIWVKKFNISYPFYRSLNELFTVLKKIESRQDDPREGIEVSSFYRDAKIVWSIQMEPSIALKK